MILKVANLMEESLISAKGGEGEKGGRRRELNPGRSCERRDERPLCYMGLGKNRKLRREYLNWLFC